MQYLWTCDQSNAVMFPKIVRNPQKFCKSAYFLMSENCAKFSGDLLMDLSSGMVFKTFLQNMNGILSNMGTL